MLNQTTKTARKSQIAEPASSSTGMPGRAMPESLEAEAAVLGSMILDRECIGLVVQKVERESFYRPEHQAIFDALGRFCCLRVGFLTITEVETTP